ncbi:MAG: hypothetical protein KAT48_01440 [Bacteroidales bacterium]|nr:hypothetical protein [Bacteroidales bacterium]
MTKKSIFDDPRVKDYLQEKEKEIQQQYKNISLVFNTFYAYNLIYQSNALKGVTDKVGITKTDFIVLSACYLVTSNKNGYFRTTEVRKLLIGVYWNEIYRAVNHLQEKELIKFYTKRGKERIFVITMKGLYAIKIYSGYYGWYYHKYDNKTLNFSVSLEYYVEAMM